MYALRFRWHDIHAQSPVIARSSAWVLHSESPRAFASLTRLTHPAVDVVFLLFPVCRTFVSYLRRTILGTVIPFDKNITFHSKLASCGLKTLPGSHAQSKSAGPSLSFHGSTRSRMCATSLSSRSNENRERLDCTSWGQEPSLIDSGFGGFMMYTFATGPTVTGWVMLVALCVMVWFAMEKQRRANFER
jgi:NADPH oxidase